MKRNNKTGSNFLISKPVKFYLLIKLSIILAVASIVTFINGLGIMPAEYSVTLNAFSFVLSIIYFLVA